MPRHRTAIIIALGASCDSGASPTPSRPIPTPAPPADARAVDAPTVDADLSYPKEWIDAAVGDNSARACQWLVYKDGCRQLRTGRVELDVSLDEHGAVASVRTRSVDISRDPHLVEQCLLREVPKWRFHPPERHTRDLVLAVVLADRC